MPTSLVGLLIFVVLLVPGFLSYLQRRALVPSRALSPLAETATLTTVSMLTNLIALSVFAAARLVLPTHTPDVGALITAPGTYVSAHLPYLLAWATGLLGVSCVLGVAVGARSSILGRVPLGRLTPVVVDVSAWYKMFEDQPNKRVYLGCDLQTGVYIAGVLDWYSTSTEETGDRDLVLGPPLTKVVSGKEYPVEVQRIILSARDIAALYVSYLD